MSRLVLFPQGPARYEHRDACSALVVALGGDLRRIIDGPFPTLDRFVLHLARARVVSASEPPLIVLTRTLPLSLSVVSTRRHLERLIPELSDARWTIFVDVEADRFFEQSACALGLLDRPFDEAPTWHGPSGQSFVVLTPATAPAFARGCFAPSRSGDPVSGVIPILSARSAEALPKLGR